MLYQAELLPDRIRLEGRPGDRGRSIREAWRERKRRDLAAERGDHLGDRGELLARAALARAAGLGGLDALPVAERDRLDAAGMEQGVEPGPPGLPPPSGPKAAKIFSATSKPSGRLVPIVPVGPRRAQPTQ